MSPSHTLLTTKEALALTSRKQQPVRGRGAAGHRKGSSTVTQRAGPVPYNTLLAGSADLRKQKTDFSSAVQCAHPQTNTHLSPRQSQRLPLLSHPPHRSSLLRSARLTGSAEKPSTSHSCALLRSLTCLGLPEPPLDAPRTQPRHPQLSPVCSLSPPPPPCTCRPLHLKCCSLCFSWQHPPPFLIFPLVTRG